jgi:ribosomal protein S18 acetylase RimI-like enzyme
VELIRLKLMFTIEKPKEIHIQSWKEIIAQSSSSHNFQYEQVNFDMFWNCIFQDDYFAFAAKNEDKFMGIIVGRINETYYQKIIELDVLFVLPDFRKIGVARALVNKIESIAKEKKLDLIIKGVEKSNLLAQKLFKNYEEISRTRFLKKA